MSNNAYCHNFRRGEIRFLTPLYQTLVAQPLDVSFFHPYWSEACHNFMQENPRCVVTKYNFSMLFSKAWYKAIQSQYLIAGFSKCGVCSYNPVAIKAPIYPTNSQNDDNQGVDPDSETEVVKADTVRDGGSVNSNSGGETGQSSHMCTCTSFTPEQVALFTLRMDMISSLILIVSWLLDTHPEDVPADLVVGVSDRFDN